MTTENDIKIYFCSTCGEQCIKELIGGYDVHTGKEKTKYICPTKLCGHAGKTHGECVQKYNGIRRVLELFRFRDIYVCMDCKEEINYYDGRSW